MKGNIKAMGLKSSGINRKKQFLNFCQLLIVIVFKTTNLQSRATSDPVTKE